MNEIIYGLDSLTQFRDLSRMVGVRDTQAMLPIADGDALLRHFVLQHFRLVKGDQEQDQWYGVVGVGGLQRELFHSLGDRQHPTAHPPAALEDAITYEGDRAVAQLHADATADHVFFKITHWRPAALKRIRGDLSPALSSNEIVVSTQRYIGKVASSKVVLVAAGSGGGWAIDSPLGASSTIIGEAWFARRLYRFRLAGASLLMRGQIVAFGFSGIVGSVLFVFASMA